jgi:signal transduction histidine kinase/ligand-binding sensor domain-containing protein
MATSIAAAKSPEYLIDTWTTDNGLPQNSVKALLQTRDGYLWLTTFDGVVRYDGVRFTVFNRVNTPGILSSQFHSLYEDRDGTLWITTEDSGLTEYRNGVFRTYTTADGLPSNTMRQIRETDDGTLLVNTRKGLAARSGSRFTARPQSSEPYSDFGYPVAPGIVWHLDATGLHRVVKGRSVRDVDLSGLPRRIEDLFEDSSGNIWAWILPHQLFRRDRDKWINYPLDAAPFNVAPRAAITSAVENVDHNVWFSSTMGNLLRYRNGQLEPQHLTPGFGPWIIYKLYLDREGGLWIPTFNGLFRIRRPVISTLSTEDGLASEGASAILQDRSGQAWIGGWPGMSILSSSGVARPYNPADPRDPGWVTALREGRRGDFWIATYGGKVLHQHDGRTDRVTRADYGLSGDTGVQTFLEDRNGNVWFGTRTALVRYDGTKFHTVTVSEGFTLRDIRAMHQDRAGSIWIGTAAGLAVFRGGKFQTYGTAQGFPDSPVSAIHEDSDGVIWIGTYDKGLVRASGEHFTNYTTRDGLFSNGAFQIVEDHRGDLWIGCNAGIYRVHRAALNEYASGKRTEISTVAYGSRQGMRSLQCTDGTQPSAFRASDGRLWFSTNGGVAIVDPARILGPGGAPPVLIEELLLDRKPVAFRGRVELKPGVEQVDIHYTAPSFTDPSQTRFKYRMTGLDSDWVNAGTRRIAYYSHIPPGSYTFEVKAADSEGEWGAAATNLTIEVLPPFWRTTWFGLLAAALCGAIATAIYRRRINLLVRARVAQEEFSRRLVASQESERKRIAGELHDSLGQNLIVMKNWALLGMKRVEPDSKAHNQFDQISAMASQALDEVREIAHNLRPHQLDELGITEAIRSVVTKNDAAGVHFDVELDKVDGLLGTEAEINLYRIVQESVNNILKHSHATRAKIALRRVDGTLQLKIEDNGSGFDVNNGHGGMGLSGIHERARMLGGRLLIHSTPGKGSIVSLIVPLQK